MAAITEAAGASRRTVYDCFENKAEHLRCRPAPQPLAHSNRNFVGLPQAALLVEGDGFRRRRQLTRGRLRALGLLNHFRVSGTPR